MTCATTIMGYFLQSNSKGRNIEKIKRHCMIPFWLCVSRSVMSDSLWPHGLYSLPGSSVHGIFQARILEWVNISFSRGSSWPRDWTRVRLQSDDLPSELLGKLILAATIKSGTSLVAQMLKYLPGNPGSIPGLRRSPGEGNGNPLQHSCLENSMGIQDREAWQVPPHRVAESDMTEN